MDLSEVLGWCVLLLIMWLFLRPFLMTFVISKKNRTGVSTSLSIDQMLEILEKHPWCDEQVVSSEPTTIPGTQLEAQMSVRGVKSDIYLYIDDGILHAHGYVVGKLNKLRRVYLTHKETEYFLAYITSFDSPSEPKSQAAAEAQEKSMKTISIRAKYDKFDRICWIICLILIIGYFILSNISFTDYSPSANAKDAVFTEFSYTTTIEEALYQFDPDGVWYDISDEDALKENGVAYAGWMGECILFSTLIGGGQDSIELTFKVELADNNKVLVSVDQICFMGGSYFSSSDILQNQTIIDVMDMIYGNKSIALVTVDVFLFEITYNVMKKSDNSTSETETSTATPTSTVTTTPTPTATPIPTATPTPALEESTEFSIPTSNDSIDTQFCGSYEMITSDPFMGANLEITYVSDGDNIYLSGFAAYDYNMGEVSGEMMVLDNQHFNFEDDWLTLHGSLLYDIICYTPQTRSPP